MNKGKKNQVLISSLMFLVLEKILMWNLENVLYLP